MILHPLHYGNPSSNNLLPFLDFRNSFFAIVSNPTITLPTVCSHGEARMRKFLPLQGEKVGELVNSRKEGQENETH